MSPLHYFCTQRQWKHALTIVTRIPDPLDLLFFQDDATRETAMHVACLNGRL